MKVVTAAEMRGIDRVSIEEYSIPGTILMNNAGKAVADFIIEKNLSGKADIFCGTGNNGGDGFTAAWYLFEHYIDPLIYIAGSKEKITETSQIFLRICENLGIQTIYLDENNIGSLAIRPGAVVIDAITGTGFDGVLHGVQQKIVKLINNSPNTVIAADIPSGLPSDGAAPSGDAVKADYTITMGLPKISLVTYPGKDFCGELTVADIGFPASLTSGSAIKRSLIDKQFMQSIDLFSAGDDIHKGDKGNTLIVGGFSGMEGAAMLTASAMFRTGTGLVTLATGEDSRSIIAGKIPELMTASIPAIPDNDGIRKLLNAKKYSLLIIGPGLGRDSFAREVFNSCMEHSCAAGIDTILIDGDGLFHLAEYLNKKRLPSGPGYVITPHFMEASRISGNTVEEIKNNRMLSCEEIAKKTGCVTVLKGPATIVSDGVNSCINTSGNRALATAGSGDILSGIIGALLNRIPDAPNAASAGVYIHGLCADIYSETDQCDTMSASDILDYIRPAIRTLP